MASLPPFIQNGWRFQHGDEQRAKATQQLEDFTSTSLAKAMMKHQLEKHFDTPERNPSAPSLVSIAVGEILETLAKSGDPAAYMRVVVTSLDFPTLRQLLKDPRTPYQSLRTFLTLPETLVAKDRSLVDVDEAVLRNEQHIRSRDSNQDGKYLVPLEDLSKILSGTPPDDGPVSFKRKDPPKGGLEFVDTLRKKKLTIQSNSRSFSEVFERITHGALRGLDWSNVFVAGGMALITLLQTDPSKDDEKSVRDPDIDVYIYGLGPEAANRKVQEIHDTWVRNLLTSEPADRLVIKSAKTINLISSYPIRRVQIILKLPPSPTDVLLNFDLDACAIGFDGSRVLMLPRCARAIETGYSVFTMDLVWGHHLSERRASQEIRIFKYANRGFGIRILPSYARSLEEDNLEAAVFERSQSPASAGDHTHDEHDEACSCSQLNRKPYGNSEPGLKSLKRIAYLGQDFLHRFFFGATPLAISQQQYHRQRDLGDPNRRGAEHVFNQAQEDEWKMLFRSSTLDHRRLRMVNEHNRALGQPLEQTRMSLAAIDSSEIHRGLPDGRKGLGNFEIFMRHCEAWKLWALGEVDLYGWANSTSFVYDPETYDDTPDYVWDKDFRVADLESLIGRYNDELWGNVRRAICDMLGIPFRPTGYLNYVTRRIRRQVCGRDLTTVQEKQITIPVLVPWALEDYLFSTVPQQYNDIPQHLNNSRLLIPVHDASRYDPSTAALPSLQDTSDESGNLRYWVITNESMWAQQHRVMDETSELMWSLFHWFNQAFGIRRITMGIPEGRLYLARSFRRRIVLPEVSAHSSFTMKAGLPSLRETLLFRPWAFSTPSTPDRRRPGQPDQDENHHELFGDAWFRYPFDDELFWRTSDEGTWDKAGVPPWTDYPSAEETDVD